MENNTSDFSTLKTGKDYLPPSGNQNEHVFYRPYNYL